MSTQQVLPIADAPRLDHRTRPRGADSVGSPRRVSDTDL